MKRLGILGILMVCGSLLHGAEPFLKPWAEEVPFPMPSEVSFPAGAWHTIVQDCDQDTVYKFLHETAVAVHGGEVFVAWYNNPVHELQGKTFQRMRRSSDAGKTWSNVELIIEKDNEKGLMYVGIQFLSLDGTLYAFTNMENGAERPVECLLMKYDASGKKWDVLGPIAERFLSMQQPIWMENGNYILSGSFAPQAGQAGTTPVVYISQGKEIEKPWRRVRLDEKDDINIFAETAVIPDGKNILAVTRLEKGGRPNFYESHDFGETWKKVEYTNFVASNSKFAGGKLSNGVRYLIFNLPDFQRDASGKILVEKMNSGTRRTLVMATAQPGEPAFSKLWKVSDPSTSTNQKASHYPCAVEANGKLYITYTGQHGLRNCGMTVIPVDSL